MSYFYVLGVFIDTKLTSNSKGRENLIVGRSLHDVKNSFNSEDLKLI